MKKVVIETTKPRPPVKDANELKTRCIEIARRYMGRPISDEIKCAIHSAIRGELLEAFSLKLIREEPTDIRMGSIDCIGLIMVFHGPFYLADWIDDVWQGPPALFDVVVTGKCEV